MPRTAHSARPQHLSSFSRALLSCNFLSVADALSLKTILIYSDTRQSERAAVATTSDCRRCRASMLTLISIMLVVKFLTFRSLSFMVGESEPRAQKNSLVPSSARLLGANRRLRRSSPRHHLSRRHLQLPHSHKQRLKLLHYFSLLQVAADENRAAKRAEEGEKSGWRRVSRAFNWPAASTAAACRNCLSSVARINVLHRSWKQLLYTTDRQVGARLFYAMLLANAQVFHLFREICKCVESKTPIQLSQYSFRLARERL